MNVLIVTEKCAPSAEQRDGGARVINTLKQFLQGSCDIMQFGQGEGAQYQYTYPHHRENRFERRLANRAFIGKKVQAVSDKYTHIIFIHISMQFGLELFPVAEETIIWTFPMFLTPSYRASGSYIPEEYFAAEQRALRLSSAILTPSLLEKRQLCAIYGVEEAKIAMIPRGIEVSLAGHRARSLSSPLCFCSVGSLKPQKNTVELISAFAEIRRAFPTARLKLIGPTQESTYAQEVARAIERAGLSSCVELIGFVDPTQLVHTLAQCHFHLSASHCETFGRSIFETLALGMPNIILRGEHAAQDFLQGAPYIAFVQNSAEAVVAIRQMATIYENLSEMSMEIGELYSDVFLGKRLIARLFQAETLIACDFDGTLFHKESAEKTERALATFSQFPVKVICSARPLSSLLAEIERYALEVDWIIAYSGAVVADRHGVVQRKTPLTKNDLISLGHYGGEEVTQYAIPQASAPQTPLLRKEVYRETAYFNTWRATKLHALCRLVKDIEWNGRIAVYGDSEYDREMITYFDGRRITSSPTLLGEQEELSYV